MTGPIRVHRDAEVLVKDIAAHYLADRGEIASVGLGLPDGWTVDAPPAVVLANDGGIDQWPVAQRVTIRITGWAKGATEAKRLANLTRGLLLAHDGHGGINRPRPGVLVQAAGRDPRTGAYLASGTVIVPIRTAAV